MSKLKKLIFKKYNFSGIYNKLFKKHAHQFNNTTKENRYPKLFNTVKLILDQSKIEYQDFTILSFGCSTGEECFTLSELFPTINIIGIDINEHNISKAKIKYSNIPNIKFICTDDISTLNLNFDLIFCMSVLCRWEDTKDVENSNKIYPFKQFENIVFKLHSKIKDGGLLVVANSNYNVLEANHDDVKFEAIEVTGVEENFVHQYNSLGQRQEDNKFHYIFKKV